MSNNNKIKNDQSMEPINPQSSIIINTEINNLFNKYNSDNKETEYKHNNKSKEILPYFYIFNGNN